MTGGYVGGGLWRCTNKGRTYRRGYAGHLILLGCSVIRRYTKIGGPLPHRATPQLPHPPCTLIHAAFNLAFSLPPSLLVSLANISFPRIPATDSNMDTCARSCKLATGRATVDRQTLRTRKLLPRERGIAVYGGPYRLTATVKSFGMLSR